VSTGAWAVTAGLDAIVAELPSEDAEPDLLVVRRCRAHRRHRRVDHPLRGRCDLSHVVNLHLGRCLAPCLRSCRRAPPAFRGKRRLLHQPQRLLGSHQPIRL